MYYQKLDKLKNTRSPRNVFIPYSSFQVETNRERRNSEDGIITPSLNIFPEWDFWQSVKRSLRISNKNQTHSFIYNPKFQLREKTHQNTVPLKILLVGIHGFFPKRIVRNLIGSPRGTSWKFIEEAELTVHDYFQNLNIPIQVGKIPLQRSGCVMERVEYFVGLLKNWKEEMNSADIILFVAHSQGCPVSVLLLSYLISNGIVQLDKERDVYDEQGGFINETYRKHIGLICMAGLTNGPSLGLFESKIVKLYQSLERPSLRELFEFQSRNSELSQQFLTGLNVLVNADVKISMIGSLNDQVVPLYSSLCIFLQHPNIFRALYVPDKGRQYPVFLVHVIEISVKLINLGYSDHAMIKELSQFFMGPILSDGHSIVYEDSKVYKMGITFTLETLGRQGRQQNIKATPFEMNKIGRNPFHLPWCMKGLIEEARLHLSSEELNQLYQEYDDWVPQTAKWRDLKYKLSGLRQNL